MTRSRPSPRLPVVLILLLMAIPLLAGGRTAAVADPPEPRPASAAG